MGSPVNVIGGSFEHNFAHNSGMDFSQRIGTGVVSTTSINSQHFGLDRWQYRFESGAGTMTFRSRKENASPNSLTQWVGEFSSTAGAATAVSQNHARQILEKQDVRKLLSLAGGKWVLSFWYRSNRTGAHAVTADVSLGGVGFTSTNNVVSQSFNVPVSGTWQKVTLYFNQPITANGGGAEAASGLLLNIGPRSGGLGLDTWNNADYFQITQVQINAGTSAANWRLCGGDLSNELAICQRYYEKSYGIETAPFGVGDFVGAEAHFVTSGFAASATRFASRFKATKRTTPVVTSINPATGVGDAARNVSGAATSVNVIEHNDAGFIVESSSGIDATGYFRYQWVANAEF